jgi:hypothetical protein
MYMHAASHWQTLSRDVVSSTFRMRDNVNEGTEKTTISQDLFNRFDMFNQPYKVYEVKQMFLNQIKSQLTYIHLLWC